MIPNDYSTAEILSLGSAHDLIGGTTKGMIFDDAPSQGQRVIILEDLE